MRTCHPLLVASADVNSLFHQPTGYDAYRVYGTAHTYSSPPNRFQFPLVNERELHWDASGSSAIPDSSATAVGSSRHFPSRPPQPFPVYSRSAAGVGMPAPSGVAPICQWSQCGEHLEDTSASGVKRHLRTHHGITRAECERGDRGQCQWNVDGRPCGSPLDFSSFPKHVSTVHLKATARRCRDCGRKIGRADSLTRHQRDHCPVRRREWPEQ